MSIVQISKIQHRSGNIVDLPQLDEAELGWATDAKKLFIGNPSPNENVEVLTSYSNISFSQLDGAVGNLDINDVDIGNGQVLTYDGNNWVNRGGEAGGLINLGDAANVKIEGGAIGYVLQTDGTGNLSWTPKSTILAYIENVTQANPAVVTTTEDNFFIEGIEITVTNVPGMTELNGSTYFVDVLSSNTFALYSDSTLTTPVDSTGYGEFPNTTATDTDSITDRITVTSSTAFTVNDPVIFKGTTFGGIEEGITYYVKAKPTGTTITISETVGGPVVPLSTDSGSCTVYVPDGRAIASITGAGSGLAYGANTTIQFNNNNILDGDADLTWNYITNQLNVNGNANIDNLNLSNNATAKRFISNIATGTPPLQVTSTTRVPNLNVAHSNVTDYSAVTTQISGTYYPVFVGGNTTANYALRSNANLSFNVATGNLNTPILNVIGNANIGNLGVSGLVTVTGNITGGNVITTGLVTATGNITGGNIITSGDVTATGNIAGLNASLAGDLSVTGNANANMLTVTGNISGGNVTSSGIVSSTGNGTFGNILTGGVISATGNITGANISATGRITTTSNIIGGNVFANTGTIKATYFDGTLITGNQPNISAIGTLASLDITGNVSPGGIKTDNYYYANGTPISFSGSYSNSNVAAYLAIYNGSVNATSLTTGSISTSGTITGNWTLTPGSSLQATYADLAEYYESDNQYEPGTVLEFGGEKEVTLAEDATTRVAGVVSTNPAYIMNANCTGIAVAVALQGRVPVKVRGKIRKGDIMISAGGGFARPTTNPQLGTIIGKALANFDGVEGTIEIAVGRL